MSVPVLRFPEFEGEWVEKPLRDLSNEKFSNGVFNDPLKVGSGYQIINVKDMYVDGAIDPTKLQRVAISDTEFSKNKAEYGDVFFTRSSLVKEGIAHSNVLLETSDEITFDGHLIRLRPDLMRSYPEFLYFLFKTSHSRRQLVARGKTGTMTTIGQHDIASVVIDLPTLPEQKKIAAFLGVVDEKLAALGARKAGLETYKRGLMQKLFSRTLRFTKPDGSPFPDWEEKRLGDISTKNDSGIYKNRDLYGSGQNIVGVSDLFSMHAIDGQTFREVPLSEEELAKNTLMEGDILYAESSLVRAGIAKAVYVTAKGAGTAFAWHTRRFAVDPEIANSAFIFYYLECPIARKYIEAVATQTALTGITTKDYFKTPVLLPHPEEQTLIANALQTLDAKIQTTADQITRMEAFKKGLLQQMFV